MIFQHFILDANESNLYVVGCEETREAVLIDAGCFDRRVVEFVRSHGLSVPLNHTSSNRLRLA